MLKSIRNSLILFFLGFLSCQKGFREDEAVGPTRKNLKQESIILVYKGDSVTWNVPNGYKLKGEYSNFDHRVYLFGLSIEEQIGAYEEYKEPSYIRVKLSNIIRRTDSLKPIPECVNASSYFLLPDFEYFIYNSEPNFVEVVFTNSFRIMYDSSQSCFVTKVSNDMSLKDKILNELFEV